MKMSILSLLVALSAMTNVTWAQVDLGGAIYGAINQATGNTQAATQAASQAAAGANTQTGRAAGNASVNAGINAGANVGNTGVGSNAPSAATNAATNNQSWLGRVSNELRGAVQPGENGALRLQNNINQTLQQYGLRSGDQLLNTNGQPLTQAQFDQYLQSNSGQVRVLRNGQTIVLGGNQSNMQNGTQWNSSGAMQGSSGQGFVQTSGRQRFGITMNPSTQGVVISSVVVGSPAAQAGLRPGDQIVSVNGQAVSDPNSMIQLVGSANASENLNVQYRRNGQDMQSQVMLANVSNNQSMAGVQGQRVGGSYQAGYAQGMDSFGSNQARSGDLNQRVMQLEQMVQQLRDEVRQLSGASTNESTKDNAPEEEKKE